MIQRTGSYRNHVGEPLEDDREFAEPPPVEIGTLRSAYSTLRRGEPRPFLKKSLISAVVFGVVLVLCTAALAFFTPQLGSDTGTIWGVWGLLALLLALFAVGSLKLHECNYVGEKGYARFPFPGPSFKKISAKNTGSFLFERARVLYTSSTRHYHNGVYTGTYASFVWMDADGKPAFDLATHYHSFKENPGPEENVQFCRAAERAWSAWVVEKHREEWERMGQTGFPLRGGGGIFLTRHSILVRQGKKETEFGPGSLKGLSLHNGELRLHREGEKGGLFSQGPFTLPLAQVGNAQAFLTLASEQLKLPILAN